MKSIILCCLRFLLSDDFIECEEIIFFWGLLVLHSSTIAVFILFRVAQTALRICRVGHEPRRRLLDLDKEKRIYYKQREQLHEQINE